MTFSRFDKTFLAVAFSGAAICLLLLIWHLNRKIAYEGNLKPAGVLTYKRYVTERKYRDRVVWEPIESQQNVYMGDSILTKDNSDAQITLTQGTLLELAPNSMIEIEFFNDRPAIRIAKGEINASGQTKAETMVLTQDGKSIDIGKASARLTVGDNARIDLAIKEGQVEVSDKDGKAQIVSKGENLSIIKDAPAQAVKTGVDLITPDELFVVSTRNSTALDFKWKYSAPIKNARLLLSGNPGMKNARRVDVQDKAQTQLMVNNGKWYWKIEADNPVGGGAVSKTGSFEIMQDIRIIPVSPVSGETIEYADNPPVIGFSWRRPPQCSLVDFTLSNDRGMQGNALRKITTPQLSIAVQISAPGDYYWRIGCNYGERAIDNRVTPAVLKFSVRQTRSIAAPVVYTPDGEPFLQSAVKAGTATLRWAAVTDAESYTVHFYADAARRKKISALKTNVNNLRIPPELADGAARLYYSVSLNTRSAVESPESPLRNFRIVMLEKLSLSKPADRQIFTWENESPLSLEMLWDRLNADVQYKVIIALDAGLKNVVQDKTVEKASLTITGLTEGSYFWQVQALDKADAQNMIVKSAVRSFSVVRGLNSVAGMLPANNRLINLEEIDNLSFTWSKVTGANRYEISIYEQLPAGRKLVLREDTAANTFTLKQLTTLKEGNHMWEIVSKDVEPNGTVRRSGPKAVAFFKISYGDAPGKPSIIPAAPEVIGASQ
jgi:hypothetical protein